MPDPSMSYTTWVNPPGTPSKPGASDLNKIQDALKFVLRRPAVKVIRTFDNVVNSSATDWTPIGWHQVIFENETTTMWDSGESTRLVAPYPGIYDIRCGVILDANTTAGWRDLRVVVNGSSLPHDRDRSTQASADSGAFMHVSCLEPLAAGSYVEAQLLQNSGAPATIVTHGRLPFFSMMLVSKT